MKTLHRNKTLRILFAILLNIIAFTPDVVFAADDQKKNQSDDQDSVMDESADDLSWEEAQEAEEEAE